jgi:nicotinate-nucleotide adenylyltransferase
MRIALFGGTFDPPHRGHIAIAKAAADGFALDQVLFAPTGLQPLKHDPATDFATRMELVAAACESDPRFAPSTLDAPRPDHTPNYTVDTLAHLASSHPDDTLFNLVGADSFLDLRRWRDPDRLLALAEWIVVTRPGYELFDGDFDKLGLSKEQRSRVHLLRGVEEDVSATELRERLGLGDSCGDLLPDAVAALIFLKKLYPRS